MKFTFGMSEVQKWAQYSGDYNPIHFDLSHAKALGSPALIVHGMLVAKQVKVAVWQEYSRYPDVLAASPQWPKFRTLFRNSLCHGDAAMLAINDGLPMSFRLMNAAMDGEYLRGSCVASSDPNTNRAEDQRPVWSLEQLPDSLLREFIVSYPEVSDAWIAIDAIVFATLMGSRFEQICEMMKLRLEEELQLPAVNVGVVHASHTVTFDARQFDIPLQELSSDHMALKMLEPDIMVTGKRAICTVPLQMAIEGRIVMEIEVGLVAVLFENQFEKSI